MYDFSFPCDLRMIPFAFFMDILLFRSSQGANCRFLRFFSTEPDLHARFALMREHISFRAFSAEPKMLYAGSFCGRLCVCRRDSNQSAFAVGKRQTAVGIEASLEHTFFASSRSPIHSEMNEQVSSISET